VRTPLSWEGRMDQELGRRGLIRPPDRIQGYTGGAADLAVVVVWL